MAILGGCNCLLWSILLKNSGLAGGASSEFKVRRFPRYCVESGASQRRYLFNIHCQANNFVEKIEVRFFHKNRLIAALESFIVLCAKAGEDL